MVERFSSRFSRVTAKRLWPVLSRKNRHVTGTHSPRCNFDQLLRVISSYPDLITTSQFNAGVSFNPHIPMVTDLRYALRSLLKAPGFTVVALITLALGIGATTAIFSVVNAVLLRPLPYSQPDELARICSEFPSYPNGGIRRFAVSDTEYFYFRRELKSWQNLAAWSDSGVNMSMGTEPARVTAGYVTGELFSTLRAVPLLGRSISANDDKPGSALVAVLSYGLWQRGFAGDPAILGREITINSNKHIVVGVMAKGFAFPYGEADSPDVWSALRLDPAITQFTGHNLNVLGRLKPGCTLSQAQAELDTLVKNSVDTGSGHHLDPKDHTLGPTGCKTTRFMRFAPP